ncbi:sensor histidine kinase [Actinomadura roseirufa]|uniref:sensor histidine kinase n=1 Tax=Actinomadura roseirufa TaxID=2094049 RepID=UPI001041860D|nr:sensor histidine kinase [Actinomadura roseirufa]
MATTRPVPWVPPLLCLAVLLGGAYYAVVDAGPSMRTAGFAACVLLVMGVEALDRRIPPAALLAVRTALYAAVNVLDVSGVSRVLFVLIPFTAYFAFGRRTAVALGAGCVMAIVGAYTVWVPDWQVRAAYISDLVMFTLGIVLAVTMAAVAVREGEARLRLERAMREVEELSAAQERNRLAREIHDSLGHHLTAIGIQLEKATAFAELDPEAAQDAVSNARWSADRALTEVRQSVRALGQDQFRLSSALTELIARLNDDRLSVTLEVTGDEGERPQAALTAVYRAAQEALTNACRHSGASRIRLSLSYEDSGASLVVTDDGTGFDMREGFGIRGMRERIGRLGGRFELASASNGTTVTVTVPW